MTSAQPKSSHIEANGVRLHVLDWGGSGTPIVIVHATGLLGCVYRPLAERLSAVGHVFSIDQRGHGDSGPAPDARYDWESTMLDLAGVLDANGWRGVRAFGHSAGATAIGSLGTERPELISRAVLVEPVVFESPDAPELGWRNPFVERTLKRKRVFDSVDAMFANFDRKPPYSSWRKDMLRDYCEFGTRATADGRRELKCTPEIEARLYDTSRDFDGLGRIIRSPVKSLILFGAAGDSLGIPLAEKIANRAANGRVIVVPDTGHFMPMQVPDYVSEQTVSFFSEP
jgi:pimeloyl-ACP methyl ester carboxylesterase